MYRKLGILLGSLVVSAALAWSTPGKGNGDGSGNREDKGIKKHVAMPEPSVWAEMAICAAGLGLMTWRFSKNR